MPPTICCNLASRLRRAGVHIAMDGGIAFPSCVAVEEALSDLFGLGCDLGVEIAVDVDPLDLVAVALAASTTLTGIPLVTMASE